MFQQMNVIVERRDKFRKCWFGNNNPKLVSFVLHRMLIVLRQHSTSEQAQSRLSLDCRLLLRRMKSIVIGNSESSPCARRRCILAPSLCTPPLYSRRPCARRFNKLWTSSIVLRFWNYSHDNVMFVYELTKQLKQIPNMRVSFKQARNCQRKTKLILSINLLMTLSFYWYKLISLI